MKQIGARVISKREAMPGVYLIWLEAEQLAAEAKPGQFVMVTCGGDNPLPRPLSIHQARGDTIALLFRVIGKGTQWLSLSQPGDRLNVFGPLGNRFSLSPGSKNILLVAGGLGIAPLYSLAEHTLRIGLSVTVLYGTADARRYPVPPEARLVAATEDGSIGYKGLVTEVLPEFAAHADQVFACGPLPMYRAMSRMEALKEKPVQVSLEVVMGCGRGVCYGCTIQTQSGAKKVCEQGPVFEMGDILWEGLTVPQTGRA